MPAPVDIRKQLGDPYNRQYADILGGSLYEWFSYYIYTGLSVLVSSQETIDGITKHTSYTNYTSKGLPGTVTVTGSDAKMISNSYLYAYNKVIEDSKTKNGTFIGKDIVDLENAMPKYVKQQTSQTTTEETRITYHSRDRYGNPIHVSKDGAENVVYLWGYTGLYPIAEISGATQAEVETAVKAVFGVTIDALSAMKTPDEDDLQTNALQDKLPNALVTTSTYKPGVGKLTSTDPSKLMTTYEYDSFGRLLRVKDHTGQMTEQYNYNYINK
jgi:YD repeat-containing protein